jgi:hypothetical protein
MELGSYSEDQLDQLLIQAESEIGVWRTVEMAVVAEKKHEIAFSGRIPVDRRLDRGPGRCLA